MQGFLLSVFGVSAIVGPTLGTYLVQHVSWSVVFWINLPIGALVNAGIARYAAGAGEVAARLMEPAWRQHMAPANVARLTSAMAATLRNVHVAGALLGLVVLFIGSCFPAALTPATGDDKRPTVSR